MNKCIEKLKTNPLANRMTNQRKMIIDYLHCVTSHPTAKTIYGAIKKKLPQISFGTVYRNLNFLADSGYILALQSVNGCVHYDGNAREHSHLICEECGKVFDLEAPYHKNFLEKINKQCRFGAVKSCRINFYGLCHECKKTQKIKK